MQATLQATTDRLIGDRKTSLRKGELSVRLEVGWISACAFAAAITAVMLGFLIWGLNRGFDMQDEGAILLQYKDPYLYPMTYSVQFVLAKLPRLLQNGIANLRLYHILFSTAGAVMLWAGFWRYLTVRTQLVQSQQWFVGASLLALSICGNLLAFTTVEYAMGYNTGAAFLVNCSLVTTLLALASNKSKFRAIAMMLSGMCACFCVFVKFPAAASVTLLNFLLIAVHELRNSAKFTLSYIAGACLAPLLFFGCVRDFSTWWNDTSLCAQLEILSGNHSLPYLLANATSSIVKHLKELAVPFAGAAFVAGSCKIRRQKLRQAALIAVGALLLVAFVGVECYEYHQRHTIHSGIMYLPLAAAFYITIASLAGNWSEELRTRLSTVPTLQTVMTVVVLLIAPLAISFGTNTPLLWHAISHSGSALMAVVVAVLLLSKQMGKESRLSIFPFSLVWCAALVTLLHFSFAYVITGHNRLGLLAQTELMQEPANLKGMYLEPQAKEFILSGSNVLARNGFKSGDYLLSLYDNPGLVWAVNGRSPGFAWFLDAQTRLLNAYLLRHRVGRYAPLFVAVSNFQNAALPTNDILQAMDDGHLAFPRSYSLAGKVVNPYMYYGPRDVYFYCPVRRSAF